MLFSSVPTHQSFEMHPHFMAIFSVRWNHEATTLGVHRGVFRSEIGTHRFHRSLETSKLHHQESTHHWQSDRIFHLLLPLDQSSMDMCSLQLLCPGSSSPIQTASDYAWHQDQNFQVKMMRNCHKFDLQIPIIVTPAIITPGIVRARIVSGIRLCKFLSF